MTGPGRQSFRRIAGTVVVALVVALIAVPAASAAPTPFTYIHSSGPLSDIYIGNDLSCQIQNGGFSSTEFFPNAAGPGDCGTLFNTGSDTADEELLGPDFANHAGGTNTTNKFPTTETPWTPINQSLTGSGTAASPYQLTTVVTGNDPFPSGGPPIVFQITEVDTYVVGNDFYRTDVTLKNISNVNQVAQGTLYHAADCQLRGSTTGFGIAEPPLGALQTGVACTLTATATNNQPGEQFAAITSGDSWIESTPTTVWGDLAMAFPGGCGSCATSMDNATGIEWRVPGLAAGASQTFSWNTVINDTVPAGGFSLSSNLGKPTAGTVATISDPNTSAGASAYTTMINWGDGNSSAGTISGSGGSFNVTGSHTYTAVGTHPISVTITSVGTTLGSATVADSATVAPPTAPVVTGLSPSSGPTAGGTSVTMTGNNLTGATAVKFGPNGATNVHVVNSGQITATSPPGTGTVDVTVTTPNGTSPASSVDRFTYIAPPPPPPGAALASLPGVSGGAPTVTTSSGAGVAGVVNPGGAPTTAYFQYGLDLSERGPGSSSTLYDQSTPPQQVGSDFLNHTVTASLTGLLPAAVYDLRLVATNSAGTAFGPDITFKTRAMPPPGPPTLGRTFNISPVSGIVLIKIGGQFIPLTELRQIPANAIIDALHGSLKLTTAIPGGAGGARDAVAKGKKQKTRTQTGTFGGAVFKITQARSGAGKGLATLAIVEGAFTGAPSYSLCTKHKAGDPSATAASVKTLQLLHAGAHGKFRTKGRYSAATVLGTKWTVADRCDGTFTHDITDSVKVTDFVRHKTIVLHAGQTYLAKRP